MIATIQPTNHKVLAFLELLASHLKLYETTDKGAYFHDQGQCFLEFVPLNLTGHAEDHFHSVHLQSMWVPPRYRGNGYARRALRTVMQCADEAGVVVLAIANPFELSKRGTTFYDDREVFLTAEGLYYPVDFRQKQAKQRERFAELRMKNVDVRIGDRQRVHRRDCFVYIPLEIDVSFRRRLGSRVIAARGLDKKKCE
ncbi:GNAT family N-acetyltransferase [Rubinisphaera sp. JC750]|uniref:GNAT family N-acetyltransferase n=1 Tax=Rubinisphaera sp. JC750 TaxID=2898658 RepID=UPI0021BCB3E0|nr:GNAT family N-acetyltransferase [Rubinisphaera sp. JC750]